MGPLLRAAATLLDTWCQTASSRKAEWLLQRNRNWHQGRPTIPAVNPENNAELLMGLGRAITQPVSRRLPNAAARVRAQVRSFEICGAQNGSGVAFLRVLRFPLPILIPPTVPHSSSIVRVWYNRPISGLRTKWTQSHRTPRKQKNPLTTG
jgi:hypothetical protein